MWYENPTFVWTVAVSMSAAIIVTVLVMRCIQLKKLPKIQLVNTMKVDALRLILFAEKQSWISAEKMKWVVAQLYQKHPEINNFLSRTTVEQWAQMLYNEYKKWIIENCKPSPEGTATEKNVDKP